MVGVGGVVIVLVCWRGVGEDCHSVCVLGKRVEGGARLVSVFLVECGVGGRLVGL